MFAALALTTFLALYSDDSTTAEMKVVRDIPYAVREGFDPDLTALDVYAPASGENHPVVVMIHGGGWRIGDKGTGAAARAKAQFFVERGYVFVSLNYRLSPAVKHPAHVEDVAAGLAWVHDHIAEHGGDRAMIFVMGHSAGAHLAALVATDERRLAAHQKSLAIVRGIVLLDGAGYDVERAARVMGRVGQLSEMYSDAFGDDPAGWKDASPLHHLAPDKGIPAALVFYTGRAEGPRAKLIQEFAAAIEATGVKAEAIHTEQSHAEINRQFGADGDEVTRRTFEFFESLRKQFAPKRQV
jgi:arylformamidase